MLCHFSLKSNLRVCLILKTWRRYQTLWSSTPSNYHHEKGGGGGAELFLGFLNSSVGRSPSRGEGPIWNWLKVRFAAACQLSEFYFSCPYHGRDSTIYLFLKEEDLYLSFFIIIIIIIDNNDNKQWEKNLNPLQGTAHMHLLWIVHKQLTCYFITTCCSCNCTSWLYDNPAPLRFCKCRPPRLNVHHLLSGCRLTNKRKMINFTLTIRNMFSYI